MRTMRLPPARSAQPQSPFTIDGLGLNMSRSLVGVCGLLAILALLWTTRVPADDSSADEPAAPADQTDGSDDDNDTQPFPPPEKTEEKPKKVLAKDPPGMKRLMPDADVWIDPKNKRVVVDGVVCLTRGTLEMFACIKGTKEHESVVAVDAQAWPIHAALLAVGAKAGAPVKFQPQFSPASGSIVDVTVVWKDEHGKDRHVRAQDWVRNLRTQKPLEYSWVFAGSAFRDTGEGQKLYEADGGDFICVSNFPSAMLDLPVESSQGTADLLFEAFSEHIPPRGTKVRLVLTPRPDKK